MSLRLKLCWGDLRLGFTGRSDVSSLWFHPQLPTNLKYVSDKPLNSSISFVCYCLTWNNTAPFKHRAVFCLVLLVTCCSRDTDPCWTHAHSSSSVNPTFTSFLSYRGKTEEPKPTATDSRGASQEQWQLFLMETIRRKVWMQWHMVKYCNSLSLKVIIQTLLLLFIYYYYYTGEQFFKWETGVCGSGCLSNQNTEKLKNTKLTISSWN